MNTKVFSQRFNSELLAIGFPTSLDEKVQAIYKVFGVPRPLAKDMLLGDALPSYEQLYKIAEVLEICPLWLSGKTDKKRAFSAKHMEEKESEESI